MISKSVKRTSGSASNVPQILWSWTKFSFPCGIADRKTVVSTHGPSIIILHCKYSKLPYARLHGGGSGSIQLTCTTDSMFQGLFVLPQGQGVLNPTTRSERQYLSLKKANSSTGVSLPVNIPKNVLYHSYLLSLLAIQLYRAV